MSRRFAAVVIAFACWSALAAAQEPRKIDSGELRAVFRVFQDCGTKAQFGPCIKHKLLTALDRINEQPEMELIDGLRLVKDPAAAPNDVSQDPSAARSSGGADDETASLDTLVVDRVVNFFKSRSLQFKLLDGEPKETADGRKKSNKLHSSLLMYPFMMGGMTVPLAFGVLALLAGKALIIAKLALALSAIVGLKKLLGGGDYGGGHEYVAAHVGGGGGGGGHYRRSLPAGEPVAAAADMAYGSYAPVRDPEPPTRAATSPDANVPL